MRDVEQKMKERAAELLRSGEAARVVGWKKGEFYFDPSPATFETEEELGEFVYNGFCGSNLSKYLIAVSKKPGKTAIFLKPCDTYSFNELVKEHRVAREKVYVIGIECQGKLDIDKIRAKGVTGVMEAEEAGDKVEVTSLYAKRPSPGRKFSSKNACAVRAKSIWSPTKRSFSMRCRRRRTIGSQGWKSWNG